MEGYIKYKTSMQDQIEQFATYKDNLIASFKKWCTNKQVPLDVRWKTFLESGLGDHDPCYYAYQNINVNEFFDNHWIHENKYYHVDMEEIFQIIYDEADETCGDEDCIFTEETIIELKEDVLESFTKSYTYDW